MSASLSYAAELTFLAKLSAAQRAHDSILCVGLDPEPASIPESLGRGPQAAVRFLRRIVRATSPHVCAYKPNLAFYERYGSAAMDVLALTLQAIPADIPVILDAKRGDVPNTSTAYADALFDSFHADAATVALHVPRGGKHLARVCHRGHARRHPTTRCAQPRHARRRASRMTAS